jgi:hypothetical protein
VIKTLDNPPINNGSSKQGSCGLIQLLSTSIFGGDCRVPFCEFLTFSTVFSQRIIFSNGLLFLPEKEITPDWSVNEGPDRKEEGDEQV